MTELADITARACKGPPTPSRTLLGRVMLDDDRALQELHDRHSLTLYAIAYAIVVDAEDAAVVVRETFDEVRRKVSQFDPNRDSAHRWLAHLTRMGARALVQARDWPARALRGGPDRVAHEILQGRQRTAQDPAAP
jgi:DNA-directed RNA polymerase specialized sigma24 family protein